MDRIPDSVRKAIDARTDAIFTPKDAVEWKIFWSFALFCATGKTEDVGKRKKEWLLR